MRKISLLLIGLLLITGAASAADDTTSSGGILESITEWISNFFFGGDTSTTESEAVTPTETTLPANGTELTPEPTVTPAENETTTENETLALPVLGTVYAVDYHTSPPYGSAPMMMRFTANATADEPVLWDFGDGHSSTETDAFHSYLQAGTYTATLTVDNTTASINVTVEAPGVVPLPENDEEMMS